MYVWVSLKANIMLMQFWKLQNIKLTEKTWSFCEWNLFVRRIWSTTVLSRTLPIYSRALIYFHFFTSGNECLISRRIYFILAIYITPSSDLNNNPIRSAVDGRRASQVYVSPPCLLVGTKQICEIAFPRARGMRNRGCTRRNRNGIRTRQFVQRATVMTSDKWFLANFASRNNTIYNILAR